MNFHWHQPAGTTALTTGAPLATASLGGLSAQADAATTTAITNH